MNKKWATKTSHVRALPMSPASIAGSNDEMQAQTYAIKNTLRTGILLSGNKDILLDFTGTLYRVEMSPR